MKTRNEEIVFLESRLSMEVDKWNTNYKEENLIVWSFLSWQKLEHAEGNDIGKWLKYDEILEWQDEIDIF